MLQGWTAGVERLKAEWAAREEQRLRDAELAEKAAELTDQRLAKQRRNEVLAIEAASAAAAAAEEEATRAAVERRRREEEQQRLRDYDAAQALQQAKVQRLVEAEQRRVASEAESDAVHHSKRVAVRQRLLDNRAAAQRQAAEERLRARRLREAELEALAASVAPVVEASQERLMAPTAASATEEEDRRALFRVDGYSNEAVFNDPRAKLSAALLQAGIAPTHEYAREVLLGTSAGKEVRRDVRSSLTLGSDG